MPPRRSPRVSPLDELRTQRGAHPPQPDLDGGWGELLVVINGGIALVVGLAALAATHSVALMRVAAAVTFGGMWLLLLDRATLVLAGVVSAAAVGVSLGFIGSLLFGIPGALLAGGGGIAAVVGIYRGVAASVRALKEQLQDDDWY